MNGEINRIVQNLVSLKKELQLLRSSCAWGRREVEDVEFFRKYVTQGNTSFLSLYNGYKKLKPFVYTLYQNPTSPSLLDSNCLKSFSFSSLKIAWSEYLSKSDKSNKRFSQEAQESYDFRRFYENLSDKSLEDFVEQLFEKSSKDPGLKNLRQVIESFSTALLFKEVFEKYISKVVLSKEQAKSVDNIVQILKRKTEEIKESLFKEIENSKESLSIEDINLEEVKRNENFDKVLARKYFVRNRGVVNKDKVESLVSEIRRSLSSKDREVADNILLSAKQFFTSPGRVKLGDVPKILGGAEAISLARMIYSYLKRLEDIAKSLEEQEKRIQKLISSGNGESVERGGSQQGAGKDRKNEPSSSGSEGSSGGKTGGGSSKNQSHTNINPSNKKVLEETFRSILLEISILYELLDFLTKRHKGFEKIKRDLKKLFKRISDAISSIADKLGLRKLLTPEGIISLLSELALQLT